MECFFNQQDMQKNISSYNNMILPFAKLNAEFVFNY